MEVSEPVRDGSHDPSSDHLPAIGLNYFCFFLVFGVTVPSLSPALLNLGFSKQQVGLIVAATYSFNALVPIMGGRLTDRYLTLTQTIRLAAFAMALTSLGLYLFAGERALLFLAFLLANAAVRSPINSLQDALAMQTARDQPGGYGRLRMVGSLGFAVGSAGFGYLVELRGIDIFFAAMALTTAVYAGVTLLLPDRGREHHGSEPLHFWRGLDRQWWLWLVAMFLHWTAFGPYHYGFTLLLLEQGVKQQLTGLYWSLGVGAEIAMFFCSAWFFRRWQVRPLLFVALGANALRWALIGLFPSPLVILASQLLHAFGFGMFYAASMSAVAHFSRGVNRASYQGLFSACVGGLGSIVGSMGAGWLHQRMPMYLVFAWMIPVQLAALFMLMRHPLAKSRPPA